MSWPASFISALSASTLTPYVRLEFLSMPLSVDSSGVTFSNRYGDGNPMVSRFSAWSGSLTPAPCSIGTGGFEVAVAGDMRGFLDDLAPGSLAALYVHPTGDASAAEVWAVGPLESITRTGLAEVFTLRFGDLLSALASRFTLDNASASDSDGSEAVLFHRLNESAYVKSKFGFLAGFTATLEADSGDFDDFEQEDGQDGTLKVLTANGYEFLLSWSSKASSTVLNLALPSTGVRNTTAVGFDAAGGANEALLYPVARITDHPGVALMKVLSSTGTASAAGIYDKLPASWGLDPSGTLATLMDVVDISTWVQDVLVATTGSWTDSEWDILASEPQDNGLKWLVEPMLKVGIFPCMRQGRLTLRALQDLDAATTRQPSGLKTTGLTISDADIIELTQLQFPSQDQEAVTRFSQVVTGERGSPPLLPLQGRPIVAEDSYSSWQAQMLPAARMRAHDLSEVLLATGTIEEAAGGDAARLLCWDALVWEKLSLKVHVRFSQLCKGDVVYLSVSNDGFYGALKETRYGYDSQPMMVTKIRSELLPPEGPACWVELVTVTAPGE